MKTQHGTNLIFLLFFAVAYNLAYSQRPAVTAEQLKKRPNLVIMISVDMLSGEIMDRYGEDLPGGLGRLQREGVFFENGFQEHAFTETGPGHSVLLSGRHPASNGISNNSWRDKATGKTVYCVEDSAVINIGEPSGISGSSCKWFKGTTFGTWLKDQVAGSRVFAVSGKDRAAILMAGPKTDGVYWFQEGFGFTTSTSYAKSLPNWLIQFNRNLLNSIRDHSLVWTPMDGNMDGITYPGQWTSGTATITSRLPRLIQAPGLPSDVKAGYLFGETQDGSFWGRWRATPFWDEAIFDATEALIRNEHIGEGKVTDLLAIGLSSTNAIEHAFGNCGPEILDQIRRLDKRLGVFLDRLRESGKNAVVVFSADHGGLDFAERLQDQGIPARRLDFGGWMKELQTRVRNELHIERDLLIGGPKGLYLDLPVSKPLGDRNKLVSKVVNIIRSMPEIAAVASYEEIDALPNKRFDDPRDESLLYRLKYGISPDRSGDILFAFQPLVEIGGPPKNDPAQHGTAHDYDRRVPIIFWGPWKGERRPDPASTTDIAPTLANELGIIPAERLDGIALKLSPK
jgi:predicted AlkP superfamily pyrophosphatase or phosphodiesterase